MSTESSRRKAIRLGALAVGVVLFFATLYYINFRLAFGTIRHLGVALPIALLFSGLWHLARTWAWWWCFPDRHRVSFARLTRVRLSAEAFSYLTLRGIAGEPLKIVLLGDTVDAREATAAVALERLAYLVGTTLIVGAGSVLALAVLPLTPVWFRVFRGFAVCAGIIGVLSAVVIGGRGTYLQAALREFDRAAGTSLGGGRVGRFAAAVERQMLDLVRSNPARLAVLLTATIASYIFMALEAWVILLASGAPITASGAVAVETFSRVASFASAFIPANLGALEASSLAAVAAVGATGGGAALALARRLRGLFWAGVGLAIYPRRSRTVPTGAVVTAAVPEPRRRATLLYFPHDHSVTVPVSAHLGGLAIEERVIRAALRAGYSRLLVWSPDADACGAAHRRLRTLVRAVGGNVTIASTAFEWESALSHLAPAEPVTAIGAGTVVAPVLLAGATTVVPAAGEVRDVPAGADWPESGVIRLTAGDALRYERVAAELAVRRAKALPLPSGLDVAEGRAPLAIRLVSQADLPEAEATIRRASYKDTDAKVARFNRRMSLPISIALIRTPLTPNQLSVMLVALGFYSAWLFSLGHYWTGVFAAFLSLAACVLDGCDGEIAITGGQPERLHAIAAERFQADSNWWTRMIWSVSFVATRAAMPYGIMGCAILNFLPGFLILAALGSNIYWVSLILKLRHLLGDEETVTA
ncbi:MAG: flippase-like domain-containing protein [Acidobacteria bacterium]|nr:flippase-like domain-containing protein [Acidobacteriota bacterium]